MSGVNLVMMRSKLFVPGSRPALFSKAFASDADAVCFDLEDSVLPEQKCEARSQVKQFLQTNIGMKRTIIVRVNGRHSSYFAEDVSALVCSAVTMVALPKVEDPSEIRDLAAVLSNLEQKRHVARPIMILATIESPRGLRLAAAIAGSDSRVAGLQLGLLDLFEPLGISAANRFAAHYARLQLSLAGGEAGIPCFDTAFSNFADVDGFAAEAAMARSMGFSGKSCIHPSQIADANQAFSPTEEEIGSALRIVAAAREATLAGLGAFALDRHMVDAPMVRRAEGVVQLAESLRKHDISNV